MQEGIVGSSLKIVPDFKCVQSGYYTNVKSCATYVVCNEKLNPYEFKCVEGMIFDISRKMCSLEKHTNCQDGYAPMNKLDEPRCEADGLYSDPKSCRSYIWCNNGQAMTMKCAQDLFFNSRTGTCTSMNQTFCIPGEMVRMPGSDRRTVADINTPSVLKSSDDMKVVCYFSSWAWLRPDEGKFVPENIDPNLCTHIIYAFAILDSSALEIRSPDPWTDLENNFYQRILQLKQSVSGLKVMLGLGGWTDSSGDKYSRLVNDPDARSKFVLHTVSLLTAYGFDGLELHWEYPVCWRIDCKKGPATDKQGFAALVRELHQAFIQQPVELLLSSAISPARGIISRAYDVKTLSANLDFMNVMTYDYHGFWEKKTGHISPLYYRKGDQYNSQNIDFSINYLIGEGADPKKLILGVPFYGQTFTLADQNQNSIRAPVVGPGLAGPITLQKGMLSYTEICQQVRQQGWRKGVDNVGAIGPFATKGDQWISYDDPAMLAKKGKYIVDSGLGGAMVWTIDFDDYLNICCREPFPLLRSLNRALREIPYPEPRPGGDCTRPQSPITPPPPIPQTTYSGGKIVKPSTEFGDLLDTSTKPTRTTWSRYVTKSTTWKRPVTASTSSTTTRLPVTTKSTTPTTTPSTTQKWWWTPPSTTTAKTTTPSTTQKWWWTSPSTTTARKTTTTYQTPTTTKSVIVTTPSTIKTIEQTTPRYTTTSSTAGGLGGLVQKPGDSCFGSGYHRHPSQCNRFLRCSKGSLVEVKCVPGLHWNNQEKICDWPRNAKCMTTISGSTPGAHQTTKTTWQPPTTQAPITRTTTKYTTTQAPITRTTTKYTATQPPQKTTWWWQPPVTTTRKPRPVVTQTWWPQRPPTVPPKPVVSTWWQPHTKVPTTTSRPIVHRESTNAPEGPCRDGAITHVVGSCQKYGQCVHGKFLVRRCPPGTVFIASRGVCRVPPTTFKCTAVEHQKLQILSPTPSTYHSCAEDYTGIIYKNSLHKKLSINQLLSHS